MSRHALTPQHARISLAIHAGAFVAVNLMLAVINLRSNDDLWFQWPVLVSGTGLAYHAWIVARHAGLPAHGQDPNKS